MAQRKEVFQLKVLKKLYPATHTFEKQPGDEQSTAAETQTTKLLGKSKLPGDVDKTKAQTNPLRRMYTVLPRPSDYDLHLEKCVTPPELRRLNPAEESVNTANEEDDEGEPGQQKRRRRRKRKQDPPLDLVKDGASELESNTGQSRAPAGGEGERLSKNKRRKLKKKRHKEKLLSMGLMAAAAPLEFTYQKGAEEEDKTPQDKERRSAELTEFLTTTLEIYMSDTSPHVEKVPQICATVEELLGSIRCGQTPGTVLNNLSRLRTLIQQKDANRLEEALMEFRDTSSMSAEETTAVVSLFKYWITDMFPMQRDASTLPTDRP